MRSRPAIIDADGHILERDSDIRQYLGAPWNRRATPLWAPSDQPWDTELFGNRAKPEGYSRELNPEQQVDTWLRVMDREGIDIAVCFPTSCGKLAYLQETSFAAAVAQACNNHLAKDYGSRTDRMKMVGVLPMQDPIEAAKELRRGFTELGLISFVILPLGLRTPLGDPAYDPLYTEAERLGCPLSIHGERSGSHQVGTAGFRTFNEVHTYAFPASIFLQFTSMIYNAVPLKFPKLRLGFLEIGATWLPYWLDRMDEHWEKRGEFEAPDLTRKPSDVVRNSSIYCTLESGESLLPQTIEYAGDHHFMYASDFPHWDTEFPENIEALWNRSGLSTETKERILYRNAKTFFGLG
jgi:predicted TIM-barrel fold metal-dependent hydrolase